MIFSPMIWAIVIAAVFLSAMSFPNLRLLIDDLFRHLRVLISLASSVPLFKWPPHVSESAQKYSADSHNLEKHPLLSDRSLIRAYFRVKRKKMTLLWKFAVLDERGFTVIFMSEAFSTINAACHDWCYDPEDFFTRKKT